MRVTLPHSFPVCLAQLLASVSSLCTVLSPPFALVSSQSYLSLSASAAGGSVAVQHPSDGNGINWKIRVAVRRGSDREEGGSKEDSVIKISVQAAGQIQHVQV